MGSVRVMSNLKRKWWIGLAAMIVVAIVAAALWPGPKEPEYLGVKLSEWLEMGRSKRHGRDRAIRAMGTNALPQLVTLVRYERPKWRTVMASTYLALPKLVVSTSVVEGIRYGSRERAADGAVFGFQCLGHEAAPAIPELLTMLRDTNAPMTRCRALICLADVGTNGAPAFEDIKPFINGGFPSDVRKAAQRIMQRQSEWVGLEAVRKAARERKSGAWVPVDENRVWYEQ